MLKFLRDTSKALIPALALVALPVTASAEPSGPPMWKVADEDTTIYLFPTVHFLTEETEWFDEEIAAALASSDELVTEIASKEMEGPAAQQYTMKVGMLPAGKSLRDLLNAEQRSKYEAGLATIGLPPETFDRFEPWLASVTFSILPLMQRGYRSDMGVEKVLERKAPAKARRDAVETLEEQLAIFDTLPMEKQIEFLLHTVEQGDSFIPALDAMVAAWVNGEPDKLSIIMNKNLIDPVLAERLLFARNRAWADWIVARMEKPGVVFMAVGGGHLAGEKSVQSVLYQRGIRAARVQ